MRRNAVETEAGGNLVVSDLAAPPPEEREAYGRRYLAIQEGLGRTDLDAVKKRMGRFFLLFPVAGQASGASADMAEAYASVLLRVPLWAVDKACQRFISAGATFRPSAPEILKAAEDACRPIYEEAESLRKVLGAEVYHQNTKTERQRVISGYKALLATFSKEHVVGKTDFRTMTKDEAARHLDALKHQYSDAPAKPRYIPGINDHDEEDSAA